ncbi:MAG: ankyrin repeat domain-containing protein [Novosphingobium sp.]|nr:ankyrin repeat domain-containing protein [Novosphingobium sp.]
MKRYIILTLLLFITLQNNIFSMEKNIETENCNQELNILNMPNEILLKIIQHIIESHIVNWDSIIDFKIVKQSINRNLKSLFLTCKHFEQFNNQKSINCITGKIERCLKLKISNFVANKRIKGLRLIEILNGSNINASAYKEFNSLVYSGADINVRDNDGSTALMYAAAHGYRNIAYILIKLGADINVKDNYGYTILMLAAQAGHTDIVRMLIDSGVDINAKGDLIETALMLAMFYKHKDIVEILKKAGANINVNKCKQK